MILAHATFHNFYLDVRVTLTCDSFAWRCSVAFTTLEHVFLTRNGNLLPGASKWSDRMEL